MPASTPSTKDGLKLPREIRGTSRNKSVHRIINLRLGAINGSYEYGCKFFMLLSQYKMKAGMRWRHGMKWKYGYNIECFDLLKELYIKLDSDVLNYLTHWVTVDEHEDREVDHLDRRFGTARLSEKVTEAHAFENYEPGQSRKRSKSDWVAARFGTKFAVTPVRTHEERALCNATLKEGQKASGHQDKREKAIAYSKVLTANYLKALQSSFQAVVPGEEVLTVQDQRRSA